MAGPSLADIRKWVAETKMFAAQRAFEDAGFGHDVGQIGRQIAGLYEGMRVGAEDQANAYDVRTAAARKAMLDQFAATEANTNAAYANSQNYQSEIAKRLGLAGVLQGPGVESQKQQMNQVLALNNVNRTNQMASYDLLRGGYGELLRDRIGSFDVGAGTSLAGLMSELQKAKAAAEAAKAAGRGRGGGGGSSEQKEMPVNITNATTETLFTPVSGQNFPAGLMEAKEGGIPSKIKLPKAGTPSAVQRFIRAHGPGTRKPNLKAKSG